MVEFNIDSKNILLVDDEHDIILGLKYILEGHDFKIDTFNDPITALKSYKTNFYDLVILDIIMPKMGCFIIY